MNEFTILQDDNEYLQFVLVKTIKNYEYTPNNFTSNYIMNVSLKSDLYKLDLELEFYRYNLITFLDSLKSLYSTLNGEAHLNNGFYDNDVMLKMSSVGNLGNIELDMQIIRYGINSNFSGEDKILFIRGMDQTYLTLLITSLTDFLESN